MAVFSAINTIYRCIEIVTNRKQATTKKNSHWFCIICTKDFLPFSELNNDEFVHTIKDKKVKFTHVTKKKLTVEAGFFQQINSHLDVNLTNTIYEANSNKLKWM